MIYIERAEEPDFWKQYKKKHPSVQYNDLDKTPEGKEVRKQIREFNIDQQHGLCAYCCKRINPDPKSSLNEHIKPRGVGKYANLSMDYNNIIACCSTDGKEDVSTCSAHKRNEYDDALFISPLDQECESYFAFHQNGKIVPLKKDEKAIKKATYTIDLLNLNSYKLRKARESLIKVCDGFKNPEDVKSIYLQPDENNLLEPHIDIIRWWVKNHANQEDF